MGAWTYLPKDSDSALDLFGDINDLVNKNFAKLSASYEKVNTYDYAGAVMLMLEKGLSVKKQFVVKARDYIKDEIYHINDGNKKANWKDPKKAIVKMIELLISFDVLIECYKGKDYIFIKKDYFKKF